jgi:uncharacterized protein GlcG (DUF336 family)
MFDKISHRPHRENVMRFFIKSSYIKVLLMSSLGVALGAITAYAQTPAPMAVGPDLDLSVRLATGAIQICAQKGYAASASVVDSAGIVKVTLRTDGAPKAPIAAPRKAATAVAFDLPGSIMEPMEASDAAFGAKIKAQPDTYNAHGGSIPLHKDGKLIGGLAIADVPHAVADQCVREALTMYGKGLN